MEIRTTYIGINENGVRGIWCGFKPDNVTVEEERNILYPAENKVLRHIETQVIFSSVWLQDETLIDEYEEIEEERKTLNDIIN